MTIENSTIYPRVAEVLKITDTMESNGVYELEVKIQFSEGEEPEQVTYLSRPTDPYGVNPQIRKWLSENPTAPVHAYVPPTPPTMEELRAAMPPLSPMQFRRTLNQAGLLQSVVAAIDAMDEPQRSDAQIVWEYATEFQRTHPLITQLAPALGLTEEQIDQLWSIGLGL